MFNFIVRARPLSPAPSSQHPALSSQHLLGRAQAYQATGNVEEARKGYLEAVEKAKTEYEENPTDLQAKQAFDTVRSKYFTFLQELSISEQQKQSTVIPFRGQIYTSTSKNPLPLSTGIDASLSVSNATQSEQVDHLFEKALSTFERLEVLNKVSLFLVYAHDNSTYGRARADIARYLIKKLSDIRVNLYSDQTPMGQPAASLERSDSSRQLDDILTSQLCLLPTQLIDGVVPVKKVVVCCSEVLGNYLIWPDYQKFHEVLREAYFKDQETYRIDSKQANASAIREVVRKFSGDPEYKLSFHHVLTEIAFLQIREEHLKDRHGIISVQLTPKSHASCLAHFISGTAVRIDNIPRFEEQAEAGQGVYPNQGLHLVLFKLIERLLGENRETKLFLDKFWEVYKDLIAKLKNEQSALVWSEFVKLSDNIFDEIWMEQLREQAQYLSQLHLQHKEIMHKLLPPTLSSADLNDALYEYYQFNLSIQRVSGDTMSLADCYINLAIVESQAQREKDRKDLEKQSVVFERLPSGEQLEATNLNKVIALEELFEEQKLRDGSEGIPKRILIQGRAGIGKTTLCKKLVYDYQHQAPWKDLFKGVLWIPLRQLKTLQIFNLKKLLSEHYFVSQANTEAFAQAFQTYKDQTLFILDGLDEVIGELNETSPLSRFLTELLNQKYVVVTSRPAGVDFNRLKQLDLELETVGFTPDNVRAYIQAFVPETNQIAIQQFIDRTPLIQGLVNIPIQIDALCYSWGTLPVPMREKGAITMSTLYQAMIENLWQKDGARLEKKQDGRLLDISELRHLSREEIETQVIEAEDTYLSCLGFEGLKDERIEFDLAYLNRLKDRLNRKRGKKLPLHLNNDLKQTSFLHTLDTERKEVDRTWHFLHLTFQEFFAAKWIVRHIEAYWSPTVESDATLVLSERNLITFIQQYKYNPRYEIVWWMVAGLLQSEALERFFFVLGQAPRDLIGARHQQVLMGCLNEARSRLNRKTVDELEKELTQWFYFDMKWRNFGSALGWQNAFPEHLLLKSLEQSDDRKIQIIQTLGVRSTLSEDGLQALIHAYQDENGKVRYAAARALENQHTLSEAAMQALIRAYQDENGIVRYAAARALENQRTLSEAAMQALILACQGEDGIFSSAAVRALGNQHMLSEAAVQALINACQNENAAVRSEAFFALENKRTLSETAIQALFRACQHPSAEIRYAAALALGSQHALSKAALQTLIHAYQDENENVRFAVIRALGSQRRLSEDAVQALADACQDEDRSVRSEAASALGRQPTLSEAAMQALASACQDQNDDIVVVDELRSQSILTEAAMRALTHDCQDENGKGRSAAVDALGKCQDALLEPAVGALIRACQDKNWQVRYAAVRALRNQNALSDAIVQALILACQDENVAVKSAAVGALGRHIDIIYTMLPSLLPSQIEVLYTELLFNYSCDHIAALYTQDHQLYLYTGSNLRLMIPLTSKQSQEIKDTFKAIQEKSGIFSPEEEPILIEE